jgi:hypothetical protein
MSPKVRTTVEPSTWDVSEPSHAEAAERERTHKERFRASLAWATVEYAKTLEKLAK